MTASTPAARAPLLTTEQMALVRSHGRRIRNTGFVFCLVGVLTMIAGRYMPTAPVWLVSVGLGTVVFGWGLFGYALTRRVVLALSLSTKTDD